MKYIECEVDDSSAYVIPIGDLHIGDKAFSKVGRKKLFGYLDWVKQHPNARIFLNGDIFNMASRVSKTSPFDIENPEQNHEFNEAIAIFEPYRDRIIGATDGNHEARMIDMFNVSLTQVLCMYLKIPYAGFSAMVRFKVNHRDEKEAKSRNAWRENYYFFFHHTTGGGGTIGSKLNRVTKLREIVEGIDVYVGSHNHQLAVAPQDVYRPAPQSKTGIEKRRIWYVDAGSYVEWENSYAEKGMLAPTKLGSPRIRLDGKKHDVHISL